MQPFLQASRVSLACLPGGGRLWETGLYLPSSTVLTESDIEHWWTGFAASPCMNTYASLHARHYDVVYAEKPYPEEARFVDSLLRDVGVERGRFLDLACGTGRHAAAFCSLGWTVTGVDISEELLNGHGSTRLQLDSYDQDMRHLDALGEGYDAITCLFDSIGYVLDDDGVLATLAAARRHLAPRGALVVEFLHAAALRRHSSPVRVRHVSLSDDGDELLRISETRLDHERSVMEVEFELLELRADGTYERWRERHSNRFFSVPQMQALLDRASMPAKRVVPAYEEGGRIDERTFHVIAVARTDE